MCLLPIISGGTEVTTQSRAKIKFSNSFLFLSVGLFLILSVHEQYAYKWPCFTDTPVCGTDGHTYTNICEFNSAKLRDRDLLILYEGSCIMRLMGPQSKQLYNNGKAMEKSGGYEIIVPYQFDRFFRVFSMK